MTHYNKLHFKLIYILAHKEVNGVTYERLQTYLKEYTRDQFKTHFKDLIICKLVVTYNDSFKNREGRPNAVFELIDGYKNSFKEKSIEELNNFLNQRFIDYNL